MTDRRPADRYCGYERWGQCKMCRMGMPGGYEEFDAVAPRDVVVLGRHDRRVVGVARCWMDDRVTFLEITKLRSPHETTTITRADLRTDGGYRFRGIRAALQEEARP